MLQPALWEKLLIIMATAYRRQQAHHHDSDESDALFSRPGGIPLPGGRSVDVTCQLDSQVLAPTWPRGWPIGAGNPGRATCEHSGMSPTR